MSDIKLFRISDSQVSELLARSAKLERDLQRQIEANMDAFLSIRFLASEFVTTNGGRIDSLGLDENGCPVIIEYKRHSNENVINQGLFYFDWLLDHKADFQLMVMAKFGQQASENIEWAGARLICIAADFNKFDEYAIKQIDRNIELMRYKYFSDDLLLLELVNSQSSKLLPAIANSSDVPNTEDVKSPKSAKSYEHAQSLAKASQHLTDLYSDICDYCESLGDDVIRKELKLYTAFKRMKNFACVCVAPVKDPKITLWLKLSPSTVELEAGFTKDVTNIGHWGTGDLEVEVRTIEDVEKVKPLLKRSFDEN